jgi:hypothetical protein
MTMPDLLKHVGNQGEELGRSKATLEASRIAIQTGAQISKRLAEEDKLAEAHAVSEAAMIISSAILQSNKHSHQ